MPTTIAESINLLERAFRARNPAEIEQTLREMVNVRVAVVDSIEELEDKVNNNCYPHTVTVPYGVFLNKIKEKRLDVYLLNMQGAKEYPTIDRIKPNNITANATYVLLSCVAGYSKDMGLTFDGVGEATGFRRLTEVEEVEKNDAGQRQDWKEHAKGTKEQVKRMLEIYSVFIEDWFQNVCKCQNQSEVYAKENARRLIIAIEAATVFHDLGKLRREWQEAVGWNNGQPYIARTKERHKVPFHAPYAYPFLRKLLRSNFGDFRILDTIALAATRHHSLEVSGFVKPNEFKLADNNVEAFLYRLFSEELPELASINNSKQIFTESLKESNKGSFMDEPPTPSDDFYFIYTLTNRVIKLADWEDAGGKLLELPDCEADVHVFFETAD